MLPAESITLSPGQPPRGARTVRQGMVSRCTNEQPARELARSLPALCARTHNLSDVRGTTISPALLVERRHRTEQPAQVRSTDRAQVSSVGLHVACVVVAKPFPALL